MGRNTAVTVSHLRTTLILLILIGNTQKHQTPEDHPGLPVFKRGGGGLQLGTHVQRHLFLRQASRSDVQPSESLSEEDGPAEGGAGKREGSSGPSGASSLVPLLRLSTQPSLLWSSWRRPGGSGSTSRVSIQSGISWRRRAQQRYSREVLAEQDRITFMLLFAAVEHAIG